MVTDAKYPDSILIVGAGVFGLSTAAALSRRSGYEKTKITVLSPVEQDLIASVDTTRIVRADYADSDYCSICEEGQKLWRGDFGANGRYTECGLLLTCDKDAKPEAAGYVAKALEVVRGQNVASGIKVLDNKDEIAKATKCQEAGATATGDIGYVNLRSGWADAGASIAYLKEQLKQEQRVEFVDGEAERLLLASDGQSIEGVKLQSGGDMKADVTILATGAWTPKLVDMRGIACARGQCMLYIEVSEQEASDLKDMVVHMNVADGCFIFPPTKTATGGYEIKVACHASGYGRLQKVSNAVGVEGKDVSCSLPWFPDNLPEIDQEELVQFFSKTLPHLGKSVRSRKKKGRMCWYLDSAKEDWIICPHPKYGPSLFLATAGSGHGFKFLPIIGEKIVDVLDETDVRERGGSLTKKWAWPERHKDDEFWCAGFPRGGTPGVYLDA